MTTVKIERRTDKGVNIENVEIHKMSMIQMTKVAKGISEVVKFVNKNDKLQNVFKQFNETRQEVKDEATEYYKAEKKKGKKDENIEDYDIGAETFGRAGAKAWNDILAVISDLLYEVPETIVDIIANASGISKEDVEAQDAITFLDIFDAIVEVNDINAIIERVKKLNGTFKKIKPIFNNQTA